MTPHRRHRNFPALLVLAVVLLLVGSARAASKQMHITRTKRADEMMVSWVTQRSHETDAVYWGIASDGTAFPHTCMGTQHQSTVQPGVYMHACTLSGLTPGARVHYRIGEKGEVFEFTAAREAAAGGQGADGSQLFLVTGDVGTSKHAATVLADMQQYADVADALLLAGDWSYADGTVGLWDTFMGMAEPLFASVPTLGCAGNHENETNYGADYGFTPYNERFDFPAAPGATGQARNAWYSLDIGRVHLLVMSTEHDYSSGSAQAQFAEDDLREFYTRSKYGATQWCIVMVHRPMYTSHAKGPTTAFVEMFETMFYRYGVSLVLNGHVHAYERTLPVYQNEVGTDVQHFPTYITVGTGGVPKTHKWHAQPKWSAMRDSAHGYATMVVSDDAILWTMYNSHNVQVDTAKITK